MAFHKVFQRIKVTSFLVSNVNEEVFKYRQKLQTIILKLFCILLVKRFFFHEGKDAWKTKKNRECYAFKTDTMLLLSTINTHFSMKFWARTLFRNSYSKYGFIELACILYLAILWLNFVFCWEALIHILGLTVDYFQCSTTQSFHINFLLRLNVFMNSHIILGFNS